MSEALKMSELDGQLALARVERPGPERIQELAERIAIGTEKVAAAQAAGVNGSKLRAAESRLQELHTELQTAQRAELRWYVLDVAYAIMTDFHDRLAVPVGSRLAIIVPGVAEVKIRLDGTSDVPF